MPAEVREELSEASIRKVMNSILVEMGADLNVDGEVPDLSEPYPMPFHGVVWTDVVYAKHVEEGTRPAFVSSGSVVDVCKDERNKRF